MNSFNNNNNSNSNNSKLVSQREMPTTVVTKAQPPSPVMAACPLCSRSTQKRAFPGRYQGHPLQVLQRMCSCDPLLPLPLGLPPNLSLHKFSHQVPLVPDHHLHGIHMPRWLGPQDLQLSDQMRVEECPWNLVNHPPP